MNVPCRRIAGVHVVHGRDLLSILDGFSDLIQGPATLPHFVQPLLGGMISAKTPTLLTRYTG